jgi:hypothetical protein
VAQENKRGVLSTKFGTIGKSEKSLGVEKHAQERRE